MKVHSDPGFPLRGAVFFLNRFYAKTPENFENMDLMFSKVLGNINYRNGFNAHVFDCNLTLEFSGQQEAQLFDGPLE